MKNSRFRVYDTTGHLLHVITTNLNEAQLREAEKMPPSLVLVEVPFNLGFRGTPKKAHKSVTK